MNDDQIAHRLCRMLDSAADDLPAPIVSRLAVARARALDQFDAQARASASIARTVRQPPPICRFRERLPGPPWVRRLVTVVPAVLLALAALAGSLFNHEQSAIQQADAYTEMLTADVPLWAYTDNGFAAHLRHGRMHTSLSAPPR